MKHVIIVGGGFAGLAAARQLVDQAGGLVEVTVLEGGDRVGGRACTKLLPGVGRAEFGATYLHGTEGHPLVQPARNAGLLDTPHCKELRWRFVEPGKAGAMPGAKSQLVQQAILAYATAREDGHGHSIGERLEHAKAEALKGLSAEDQTLLLKAWRWHEVQLMLNTSAPSAAAISSAWWDTYEDLDGPNYPIVGGFQSVAEHLAEGLDVRLNEVVSAIRYGTDGVIVESAAGRQYKADAVIFTCSLGVLKEHHKSIFSPPLPPAKAEAIGRLGFGYNEKIFMKLDAASTSAVHQVPAVAYQLLWDIEWPNSNPCSTGRRNPGEVPSWAHGIYSFRFGGSEFKPQDSPTPEEGKDMMSSEAFPQKPDQCFGNSSVESAYLAAHIRTTCIENMPAASEHPNTVCLWVSGESAKAMAEASEADVRLGVAQILDSYPFIPFDSCQISEIWISNWSTSPLFKGAYSYVPAGSSTADVDQLAAPILDAEARPLVLFAGEATSAKHTATTHGAFLTGVREADRLLTAWQIR